MRQYLVACPSPRCSGANFDTFNFCQWCGRKRLTVPICEESVEVDEKTIAIRRDGLLLSQDEKKHSKAKAKEFAQLQTFVASRVDPERRRQSVFKILPIDVVDFVIHRDLGVQDPYSLLRTGLRWGMERDILHWKPSRLKVGGQAGDCGAGGAGTGRVPHPVSKRTSDASRQASAAS